MQSVLEVKKHFQNMVFKIIIPRNIKLGKAPNFGMPAIIYDLDSKRAVSYLTLLAKLLVELRNNIKY